MKIRRFYFVLMLLCTHNLYGLMPMLPPPNQNLEQDEFTQKVIKPGPMPQAFKKSEELPDISLPESWNEIVTKADEIVAEFAKIREENNKVFEQGKALAEKIKGIRKEIKEQAPEVYKQAIEKQEKLWKESSEQRKKIKEIKASDEYKATVGHLENKIDEIRTQQLELYKNIKFTGKMIDMKNKYDQLKKNLKEIYNQAKPQVNSTQ